MPVRIHQRSPSSACMAQHISGTAQITEYGVYTTVRYTVGLLQQASE